MTASIVCPGCGKHPGWDLGPIIETGNPDTNHLVRVCPACVRRSPLTAGPYMLVTPRGMTRLANLATDDA